MLCVELLSEASDRTSCSVILNCSCGDSPLQFQYTSLISGSFTPACVLFQGLQGMVFHIVTIKPRGLMLAGEFEEGAEGLQQLPSAFAHPLYGGLDPSGLDAFLHRGKRK